MEQVHFYCLKVKTIRYNMINTIENYIIVFLLKVIYLYTIEINL